VEHGLLALLADIRIDLKGSPGINALAYLASDSDEKKFSCVVQPGVEHSLLLRDHHPNSGANVIKLFCLRFTDFCAKLDCYLV
jgi:hypothetical protein